MIEVVFRDAAEFQDVILMLLVHNIDHIINGEHAGEAAGLIDYRGRDQILLPEEKCRLLLVHADREHDRLAIHDLR